jgi:hypothetical protein
VFLELSDFMIFPCKGLDHLVAVNVFRNHGSKVSELLPEEHKARAYDFDEPAAYEEDKGCNRRKAQCQLPVDKKQKGKGTGKKHHAVNKHKGHPGDRMPEPVQILSHPGHQVSGGEFPQEFVILKLDDPVHILPHFCHGNVALFFQAYMKHVAQPHADNCNNEHDYEQPDQRLRILWNYYIVNQPLGKHGIDNDQCRRNSGKDKAYYQQAPFSLQVFPKPTNLGH